MRFYILLFVLSFQNQVFNTELTTRLRLDHPTFQVLSGRMSRVTSEWESRGPHDSLASWYPRAREQSALFPGLVRGVAPC